MQMQFRGVKLYAMIVILSVAGGLSAGDAVAEGAEVSAGKAEFLTHKCNLCHAVPAAEIDAKTKSEKLKGPALGGAIEADFGVFAAYVRKQGELDGKAHKKEFKGTDEELKAILDWLAEFEPAESSAPSP